jgi:hypothetical protein
LEVEEIAIEEKKEKADKHPRKASFA